MLHYFQARILRVHSSFYALRGDVDSLYEYMRALASQELNPMIIPPDILKTILHRIMEHAQYELEGTYVMTLMEGMFVSLPIALDVKLCLVMNGHLCMFDQALYPIEHINWCIYALFINDQNRIRKDCFLKTLNRTTNLAYSLDGYLWAVSALAAEKLQVRCVMGLML